MTQHSVTEPLRILHELLHANHTVSVENNSVPETLSLELLRAWKPLAESLSRAQSPHAEEVAHLLIAAATQNGDASMLAHAHWIAGNIFHDLDLMVAANQSYAQAQHIFDRLQDALSGARMSVGWIHVLGELAEYEQALTCARRAEAMLSASDSAEDRRRLAALYGNWGIVCEQMQNFVEAVALYERRRQYFDTLPNKDMHLYLDEAITLNDIGIIQTLLGQYFEAEQAFLRALALLAPYDSEPLIWVDLTRIQMNRAALAALSATRYETIHRLFQQAQESRTRLPKEQQQRYFAILDILEAGWLLHLGRWQEVDPAKLQQLEELTLISGVALETDMARLLLGQYEVMSGKTAQALARFEQIENKPSSKSLGVVYFSCLWQARVLHQVDQPLHAEAKLKQAIALIETIRGELTTDEQRAGYLEDKLVAYQELTALYLEKEDWQEALATSEQSKARTLRDALLTLSHAEPAVNEPASALLSSIVCNLPADTIVLSYTIIHNQVWAFLLNQQGIVHQPLQLANILSRGEMENGLRCIQLISRHPQATDSTIQKQIVQAKKFLALWHETYLAPLQTYLQSSRRIIISPDGLLNMLPFASLLDRHTEHYLAETHEVLIAPSLTLWASIAALAQQYHHRYQQPITQHKLLSLANSAKNGTKGQLPNTLDEARAVAANFAAPLLLLEEEATCLRFMQEAPHADLIYIAAHGEYRIGEPAASFIELADGQLAIQDILKLRLQGAIVILSACETSKGHLSGNEMLGLVRAFLYAGARSVVATYWPVDDSTTSSLMTIFMLEYCQSGDLTNALCKAQRSFLANRSAQSSHPFYWGAPAIFGAA